MNTQIISVGAGALVILAVLFVGNMVVNTTPAGVAKTTYEYKTVRLHPKECDNKEVYEEMYECRDGILNQHAEQGWEFYSYLADTSTIGLFRKPR